VTASWVHDIKWHQYHLLQPHRPFYRKDEQATESICSPYSLPDGLVKEQTNKKLHTIYTVHIHTEYELNGSVKEPNKFHIYETEKITRKASDAAECIELFGSFTRDRHARCI